MGLFGLPNIDKLKQRGNKKSLNKALNSRYPWNIRVDAALALAEMGDDRGRQEFISILAAAEFNMKAGIKESIDAVAAVLEKEDKALPLLSAIFADPELDFGKYYDAATILKMIGNEHSQDTFMDALEQNWEDSRMSIATDALVTIGSERLVDRLVGYVYDANNRNQRIRAMKILGAIGSSQATECLLPALAEDNEHISRMAAIALGQIGDVQAIAPLIDKLGANNCLSRESPSNCAAHALVRIGESAVGPLVQALSNPNHNVRMGAVYALIYLKTSDAVSKTSDAVPALIKILEGPDGQAAGRRPEGDWLVARLACDALQVFGDRRAVPALKAVKANKSVRKDAEKAIEALT